MIDEHSTNSDRILAAPEDVNVDFSPCFVFNDQCSDNDNNSIPVHKSIMTM